MKNLLIINGQATGGKDLFCNILSEISSLPTTTYSIIDYAKEVANISLGWDGIKDEKGRRLLADLNDIMMEYNELPFKKIHKEVAWMDIMNEEYTFMLHMRKPKEIRKIVGYYQERKYNVITIFINNEKKERKWNNEADDGVFDYKYDWTIDNDGTYDEFWEAIEYFYKTEIVKEIEYAKK